MKAQQPNLLYVFTDEQRLDTLACYGNRKIEMPHLNRLAKRSVVFSEPYCCQPVCTPSRGSLMSGLYPHTHGEMMGSHQMLFKCNMFKESTQVPLLIHLPGQTKQGRINGPVSQIDLLPTLLDLMGEDPVGKQLHGTSLAGLCRDSAAKGTEISATGTASPCVVEWTPGHQPCNDHVRTIITPEGERFSHYSSGTHEFYDLNQDPGETCNLSTDKGKQARMRELCAQLNQWQSHTADTIEPVALQS